MRRMTAVVLAALVLAGLATGCSDDRVTQPGPARRVLIVTMPGVTWSDVSAETTPNLDALVGRSAISMIGLGPQDNISLGVILN